MVFVNIFINSNKLDVKIYFRLAGGFLIGIVFVIFRALHCSFLNQKTRVKAGFHKRRSRSQKRRAYDLVKTAFRLLNVSDGVVSRVGRKWKRSDSFDSDSVALMTPLTTPIFDFHYVISALTTPLTTPTPTPSLVKTSLNQST